MKNMNVFDSGLKIAETPDGFEIGSQDNYWAVIPYEATRLLFDLKPVSHGVITINKWISGDGEIWVEVSREQNRIMVHVAGASHTLMGEEMKDLRKVILGTYAYNSAYEPPVEVVAEHEEEVCPA
jgi:hypothetical protein